MNRKDSGAMNRKDSGFACMECGHRFKTIAAAERASFSEQGCPKCGGSDIDLAPVVTTEKNDGR